MSTLNPGLRLSHSEAEIVQAEPDWHDARRAPGQPTEKKNTWWLPAHGLAIRLEDRKQKMKLPGADPCQGSRTGRFHAVRKAAKSAGRLNKRSTTLRQPRCLRWGSSCPSTARWRSNLVGASREAGTERQVDADHLYVINLGEVRCDFVPAHLQCLDKTREVDPLDSPTGPRPY